MKRLYILLALLLIAAYPAAAGELKPDLAKKLSETRAIDDVPVIITFNDRPTQAQIYDMKTEGVSIKHQYKIINAIAARMSPKAAEAIAKRNYVKSVDLDYNVKSTLDYSSKQISADQVWAQGVTGKNIEVAIVDTGITYPNSVSFRVIKEIDFTGEGTTDLNGHGTHVAGIVASRDPTYRGIAYDSALMNVKVLNKNGEGTASDVIRGIEWAVYNGAEIITLSLGAQLDSCDGTDSVSQAVDKAAASGVLVVIAAGNSGPTASTISAPACAQSGFAVGAVDDINGVADFSSRGPTADGRTKPDVVAPGVGIISISNDLSFTSMTGTSMSAPHVSGLAALLLEAKPGQSPSELMSVLKSTAKNLGADSNTQGAGLVNAYAAYAKIANITQEITNQTYPTNITNQTYQTNLTNQTGELKPEKKIPPGIAKRTELPPGLQKKVLQGVQSESLTNMLRKLFGITNPKIETEEETEPEVETRMEETEVEEHKPEKQETKKPKPEKEHAEAKEERQDSQEAGNSATSSSQQTTPAASTEPAKAVSAESTSAASSDSSKPSESQGNKGGSSDSTPGNSGSSPGNSGNSGSESSSSQSSSSDSGSSHGNSGGNSDNARGNSAITGNAVMRFFNYNVNQLKNFINQLTNKNQ